MQCGGEELKMMSWLDGAGGKYGAKRNACRFLVAEPKQRGILEDLRLNERVVLKWVLKKEDEKAWTGFF